MGLKKDESFAIISKSPSQHPGYSSSQTPTLRPPLTIHFPILFRRKHSLGPWRHWPGTRYRRPTSLSARQPRRVGLLPVEHPNRRLARQWAPVVLNSNLSRIGPLAPHLPVIVFARTNHADRKEAQSCKHISQERMLPVNDFPTRTWQDKPCLSTPESSL